MPTCSNCGREYPENEQACPHCGTAPVSLGTKPARFQHFPLRFLVSVFVAAAVTALAIISAFQNSRGTLGFAPKQFQTEFDLRWLTNRINDYQRTFHHLPPSLVDLTNINQGHTILEDSWGRALIYNTNEHGYSLLSYGRDGLPGGVGLDADLSNTNLFSPSSRLTFNQFLFDVPSKPILWTCVAAGIMAAITTFFLVRKPATTSSEVTGVVLRVVCTVLGATIIAAVLAVLHIPTGH
jgi:general secretion pathway protein G